MIDMPLYFAYGSNLDRADWSRFCARESADPDCIRPIGPALLPDSELAFNYRSEARRGGALNLARRRGQVVHGVLYEVSSEGWAVLDRKEGVAAGRYARSARIAIRPGGETVPVMTYEVVAGRVESFVEPTADYVDIVSRGLAAHGLPRVPLDAAARGERQAPVVEGFFVYGTLMRGEKRFGAIAAHRLRRVLLARGAGRLHATDGDYPMLDLAEIGVGDTVRGEVMHVEAFEAALEAIDAVEDFFGYGDPANEYVRTVIEVDAGEATPRLAWTYAAADRRRLGAPIASGCWRSHRGVSDAFMQRLAALHHRGDEGSLDTLRAATGERVAGSAHGPAPRGIDALAPALASGRITEYDLARLSGNWAALIE